MTLVLGAMDGEVASITASMDLDGREEWNGYPIARGSISGSPVVVSRTGVGKTLSAMLCQHLIDRCAPRRIIFTGIAGALREDLAIGDIVVARDTVQHDVDLTAMGFERGRIPGSPHRMLRCDPVLIARALDVHPVHGRMRIGRILTGDQFIGDAGRRADLVESFNGDAVDMEGASVGLVAAVNRVPFLLVRTISDRCDGSAIDFRKLLKLAADNSWHYVQCIVGGIDEHTRV